jgi:hypothetical protein
MTVILIILILFAIAQFAVLARVYKDQRWVKDTGVHLLCQSTAEIERERVRSAQLHHELAPLKDEVARQSALITKLRADRAEARDLVRPTWREGNLPTDLRHWSND